MSRPFKTILDENDSLELAAKKTLNQNRREMMQKYLNLTAQIVFDDELTVQQIEAIKRRLDIMREVMDGPEG